MNINTAIEIINNIIKNEEYNKQINEYIERILNHSWIINEENGKLIISDTKFNEYLSILIIGPETIIIDVNYHNKKENFHHQITYTNINEETEIESNISDENNIYNKKEQYINNEMKYFFSYDFIEEENKEIIKEMIFKENICFSSYEEIIDQRINNEECLVNKVETPYILNTIDNKTEFKIKVISQITRKQYDKALKYEIKQKKKQMKIKKRQNEKFKS